MRLTNKICFSLFLLISVFDFYRCYGNKNGRQNRLKTGNWLFGSKFETFDRDINIEHKQIPKRCFDKFAI